MTEEGVRQNRASDPVINSCKLPCGCWELNSGPHQKKKKKKKNVSVLTN
jgi:hypothetical protein